MKEVQQWWSEIGGSDSPWLLLGKGPTFQKRDGFDLTPFRTVALNHVVREMKVDVATAIDMDVVQECGDAILRNSKYLLMPRYPHVGYDAEDKPPQRALETYVSEIPVLRQLDEENRLIWFNLYSGASIVESPRIKGKFSGDVITSLLATLGARRIRTLGLDGGTSYASQFHDLNQRTRLANGHASFDVQNQGIAAAIQKFDLDYAPLTSECPIRIYIGTDETQLLGAKILEYSVRKHSTITSQFDTMMHVKVPMPKDPANQPRTNFSFNRFAIPKLAGYRGRAVYVDADMQVFRDFREMWDIDFDGATVLYAPSSDPSRPKQFSVLLLNCDELRWDVNEIVQGLDSGKYDYDQLMKEFVLEPAHKIRAGLPTQWNSLEEYVPGETGLIHYTDMMTQPWVSRQNPNGELWVNALRDAIHEGFVSMAEVQQAIQKGYVRPSLLVQLKANKRPWRKLGAAWAKVLDKKFQPHSQLSARLSR